MEHLNNVEEVKTYRVFQRSKVTKQTSLQLGGDSYKGEVGRLYAGLS